MGIKHKMIGIVFLLMVINIYAMSEWQIIKAIPDFNKYIDRLYFYDDVTGWACAYFDGVLKTEDGGYTWRRLESHYNSEPIYAVWFTSKTKGWAVAPYIGNERARSVDILSTVNGGVSWRINKQISGKNALYDIYFKDTQHGWAVGSTEDGEGLIIGTTDGGTKWNIQAKRDVPNQLCNIRFADLNNGWAIGSGGVLHTTDGGRNWNFQGFADCPLLKGLCVIDSSNVWISGGYGVLYRTADGGKSWSKPSLPLKYSQSALCKVNFADPNTGWVSGDEGLILSTTDGGRSWIRVPSPITSLLDEIAISDSKIFFPHDQGFILMGLAR